MKILIIQQKMIGDVLTSSILFEVLRKEHPGAELHYLIYRHTFPVVEHNPYIDKFLLFEEETLKPQNFISFLKEIRKEEYDVVIDVYSKISTAILASYSKADITVSYEKWYTRHLYTHVSRRKETPTTAAGLAIENRLNLTGPLVKNIPAEVKPRIWLTEKEIESATKTLKRAEVSSQHLLIMISVLGSSESKTYPPKYLAKLLDIIVEETNAQLLFNYIPKQLKEAQNIFNLCKPKTQKNIYLEIFGKSLREFMALTSRCDALIGNEGGAVNMAKAMDVPTFAIFSPAINKEDWGIFEDKTTHNSVHLKDYHPEFFLEKSQKDLKKESEELYLLFKPQLIDENLKTFLRNLTKEGEPPSSE